MYHNDQDIAFSPQERGLSLSVFVNIVLSGYLWLAQCSGIKLDNNVKCFCFFVFYLKYKYLGSVEKSDSKGTHSTDETCIILTKPVSHGHPLMSITQSQLKHFPLIRNSAVKDNLEYVYFVFDNGTVVWPHRCIAKLQYLTSRMVLILHTHSWLLCGGGSVSRIKLHCRKPCWTLEGVDVVRAVTQRTGMVTLAVDGDIIAGRGDSWATNACLPEHWRGVRDWSIEKRQNHRVRLSLTSEPVQSCSFSLCLHTQWPEHFMALLFRNSLSFSYLTLNRLNPELLCVVFSHCSQY